MNVIFQIDGGLGKVIMSTAMVKVIKKKYKNSKIIIISAFPDVFLNNPNVYATYRQDQINGLYVKYIKDQKCKIFAFEPYMDSDFILKKPIHLLKIWCKIYGLNYKGEKPQIYLTKPEIDYFSPYYQSNKPFFVIQPHGGSQEQGYQYSWTRDIPTPIVKQIIDHYKNDYTIIHIKHKNQITYPDTLQALDGYRSIAILLQLSKKRLLIDSFAQHLAYALNLPSTVCWVNTKPEVFGYDIHDNIKSKPWTKIPNDNNASYTIFNLSEDTSNIPYNDLNEIFNVNKLISSLDK